MGILGKIFGGQKAAKTPKGFFELTVAEVKSLTPDSKKIVFSVPDELKDKFLYTSGQYLDLAIELNGKVERRSYSICSGKNEALAIGVKEVEGGLVSVYLNQEVKEGDVILVSQPLGNFTVQEDVKNVVAITAGSGITPVLSIAKDHTGDGTFRLYYGNRTEKDIMFRDEIDQLENISTHYYLSREEREGFEHGRLDRDAFSKVIQSDLSILRSDAFLLCGPAEMILDIKDLLKMFGVNESKIRFELFSPPEETESDAEAEVENFEGLSSVTIRLDDMEEEISVAAGKYILDKGLEEGLDLPYSCKGGVCSTCKAKVLEGKVKMKLNYSLTDKEVADGYILSCQAIPASDKIKISYDD